MGDFAQSLAFAEKAIELDDRVNCTHKSPSSGADPAIVARDLAEMALRHLGHLDRSLTESEQCMTIAMNRGHPFSIVWASVSRVLALTSFGRYAEEVAETTDEKMHLAEIIRLRGRLLQAQGCLDEAKMCFERAIARAHDQQARLFELNAVRDLTRLGVEAGDAVETLERLRAMVD